MNRQTKFSTPTAVACDGGNRPVLRAWLETGVWIIAIILIVTVIQLSIPYPLDDDTAYHFSVARLIREHGILESFPWTRFSWQNYHYADKEFFFHILFIPFVPFGYDTAARIVGVTGGAFVLSAIYAVLRVEQVRYAGVWALLPLGTTIFLYRFSQVRPHLFSIGLAILLLWAYCRRRYAVLVPLAVLYPLVYVAFWQIPLLLVTAAEAGLLLAGGRQQFCWRRPAILVGSLAAGVALHPNALNLIQMNWIHMTDILFRNAWGNRVEFNMGEEFEPFYPDDWLEFLLPSVMMAGIAVRQAWRHRREEVLLVGSVITTMFFCLLTMRTNRFLEYFVPFSVLSLGLSAGKNGQRQLIPLMVAISIAYTAATGIPLMKYLAAHDQKQWHFSPHIAFSHFPGMEHLTIHEERTWQMGPATIAEFDRLLPKEADVFTCGWEYTGTLLLNLPDRDFMVALDPTLLYKHNPVLYNLWYHTLKEAPPASAEIVRKDFASRYVVCLDHPTLHPFFDALAADKGSRALFSDGKWVLFDLRYGEEQ